MEKQASTEHILDKLRKRTPLVWIPGHSSHVPSVHEPPAPIGIDDIMDADNRLTRFAPLLARLFPELVETGGIIESPLSPAPAMQKSLESVYNTRFNGTLYIKQDHALPVAGSVKARGGVYEVLHVTEQIAKQNGLLKGSDPYTRLADPDARKVFQKYTFSVGSTGNLGLSIGITATAPGFKSTVHMSSDAKEWKKELLRSHGVEVIEHPSDYSTAVTLGREAAAKDPYTHFVDDEHSLLLFLGYSVAALRLRNQLKDAGITVDARHPLLVYLPCGVGGAPAGITFGLKQIFGDAVHCFFVEPLESPCVLLGLLTGFTRPVSVYDVGLSNKTDADGLAVAAPSMLAGRLVAQHVAGCITVPDEELYRMLYMLHISEGMQVEPSAAAGLYGYTILSSTDPGKKYLEDMHIPGKTATHIAWTTGGRFLPPSEFQIMLARGKNQ